MNAAGRMKAFGSGRRVAILLLAAVLLALSGCVVIPRPARTPIPTRTWKAPGETRPTTLIVFLSGRGDRMEDFDRRGFLEELRRAGIHADVTAADAHLGYYRRRTVITRVREDIIAPARAAGYRRVVIVGISLGGLGGLLGERETSGLADALVVIAPYLGERPALFSQVAAAGGPEAWSAGRGPLKGKVDELIWTFLGRHHRDLPPTWLAYGTEDSFRQGQALFATLLPPARVRTVPGGHTWSTWLQLWRELCENTDVFAAEKA